VVSEIFAITVSSHLFTFYRLSLVVDLVDSYVRFYLSL